MVDDLTRQVRQAAEFIKSGQPIKAREILVPLLRENGEVGEAWFLLSYTTADREKQLYSLNQALRINPQFNKAQERLEELQQPAPSPSPGEEEESFEDLPEIQLDQPDVFSSEPLNDVPDLSEMAEADDVNLDLTQDDLEVTSPFYDSAFEDDVEEEGEALEERPQRDWTRIRQRLILLSFILLLLWFIVLGFGNLDKSSNQSDGPDAPISTAESTEPQGFRTLPPTWTPNTDESGALLPEQTPTPIPGAAIEEVPDEILLQFEDIQEQIVELRQVGAARGLDVLLTDEISYRQAIDELFASPVASLELGAQQTLFTALQLIADQNSFEEVFLEQQLDPPGSFYDARFERIFLLGAELDLATAYAFAYSYAQALLDAEFGTVRNLLDRDCTSALDTCLALGALLKAEARTIADSWLAEFALETFQQAEVFEPGPLFAEIGSAGNIFLDRRREFILDGATQLVGDLFSAGEWQGLNLIHADQRLSTSEILNAQILEPTRSAEIAIPDFDLALGGQLARAANGQLGQWLTVQWLSANVEAAARLPENVAVAASAGVLDEHFQLYTNADQYLLSMQWLWPDSSEQDEFEFALQDFLSSAYPEIEAGLRGAVCRSSQATFVCWFSLEAESALVITSNPDLLDPILDILLDTASR